MPKRLKAMKINIFNTKPKFAVTFKAIRLKQIQNCRKIINIAKAYLNKLDLIELNK